MLRKIITSMLFVTFFAISLSALEVDVDEIAKSKKINFINYTGKKGKFETSDEIKSIGFQLAYKASKGNYNEIFRYHMKYSVIRVDSNGEPDKYAADILFIDKDARVDHIKNVRRIIAAYLEGTYSYTPEQARALALYITYYNALHRGDMEYFRSVYQSSVLEYITEKNAGIAIRYDQWPGKTALLIPLTSESKRGKIDTIDPFAISDDKTKDEIKKDKENDEDNKEIIKLKEDEIEKKKDELEKEKKKTDEDKKKNEKKREDIEKKKEDTEKKKDEIKKEKEETKKITDPEEKKKKEEEIKKKEDKVKEEEKTNKKEEEKLKKEEEKTKEEEKDNEKKEDDIKKKEEDVKKEKDGSDETKDKETKKDDETKESDTTDKTKDSDTGDKTKSEEIKKKEEELKEKEKELDKREDKLRDKDTDPNVYGLKIYYLEVKEYLEGGHYNNTLYMINATTKKIDFKSPVTNICGRRYDIFSEGIIVITHKGSHTMGHRLTLIDRKSLTEIKSGTDNVFWRSFIEFKDGFIYAIVKEDENYYLGKFDTDLKLVARSKEKINQNSFITFYEESIYINREDMTIIVLKKDDLSLVDVIKP